MLERKLRTQDWSFRVNTTILGICIVDAWLLFCGEQVARLHICQREFYEDLAFSLIENRYDTIGLRKRTGTTNNFVVLPARRTSGVGVHLTPTKKRRKRNGMVTKHARQNNCRVCKTKKTTHVCSVCSELKGEDVWICHTSAARDCFMEHLAHCHD